MHVRDVMSAPGVVVLPHVSWREVAGLLLKEGVSTAYVVDEQGKLVGIVSEKDLFRGIFPGYKEWTAVPHAFLDFQEMEQDLEHVGGKVVADLMATRLITAEPDTPILKVGALMVASGIHHVPVVKEGVIVGSVGRGDIYRAILQRYFEM